MVKTTRAQREALFKIFQRDFPTWLTPFTRVTREGRGNIVSVPSVQYRRFRAKAIYYLDGSGCIMIPWKGMWLGVEPDGYTHS